MGRVGSGIATPPSIATASLDASAAAMERGGVSHGRTAIVFVSGDAPGAAHEVPRALRRDTGARTERNVVHQIAGRPALLPRQDGCPGAPVR
jgi:hypothetical protein